MFSYFEMSEWREHEKGKEQNFIINHPYLKESEPIIEVISGASTSTSFSPMTIATTNLMRSSSAEVKEKISDLILILLILIIIIIRMLWIEKRNHLMSFRE